MLVNHASFLEERGNVCFIVSEASRLEETLELMHRRAAGLSVMGHHIVKVAIMSGAREKVVEEGGEPSEERVLCTGFFTNCTFNHCEELGD